MDPTVKELVAKKFDFLLEGIIRKVATYAKTNDAEMFDLLKDLGVTTTYTDPDTGEVFPVNKITLGINHYTTDEPDIMMIDQVASILILKMVFNGLDNFISKEIPPGVKKHKVSLSIQCYDSGFLQNHMKLRSERKYGTESVLNHDESSN